MRVDREQFAQILTTIIYELVEQGHKIKDVEVYLGQALGYENPQKAQNYIRLLRSTQSNKGLPVNPRHITRHKLLEQLSETLFKLSEAHITDTLLINLLEAGGYFGAEEFVKHLYQRHSEPIEPIWEVPEANYTTLFGTDDLVDEITTTLVQANAPRFISLEGIGGSGKTSIAHKVASRLRQSDEFKYFIWVSCRRRKLDLQGNIRDITHDYGNSINDVLSQMFSQLGFAGQLKANASIGEKIKLFQQLAVTTKRILVIIDNAESVEDVEQLVRSLSRIHSSYYFLITTRRTLRNLEFVHVRKSPRLSFEDAYKLMQAEIVRQHSLAQFSTEQARKLYQLVGGNPLALKMVAPHINIINTSLITPHNQHPIPHFSEDVYDFLFQQIWEQLAPRERYLLLDMLLISPDGENADWIFEILGLRTPDSRIPFWNLINISLISLCSIIDQQCYFLHPLVVSFLHHQILDKPVFRAYFENRLETVMQATLKNLHKSQRNVRELRKHILSFLLQIDYAKAIVRAKAERLEIMRLLGDKPQRFGFGDMWEGILRAEAESLHDEPILSAEIWGLLADNLQFVARYDEALVIAMDAYQLASQHHATDVLINILQVIAVIHATLRKWQEGSHLLNKLRSEIHVEGNAQERLNIILTIYEGQFLRASGNLSGALKKLDAGIVYLDTLAVDDPSLAVGLFQTRGVLRWANGNYEGALHDLQQTKSLFAAMGDVFGEGFCDGNLGLLYWSTARYDEAEKALKHSIEVYTPVKAQGFIAMQIGNLGLVNLSRGLLEDAIPYCEQHLRNAENLNMTSEIFRAHGNLSIVLLAQRKIEAALYHLEYNLTQFEEIGTKGGLMIRWMNLALGYHWLGENTLAQQSLQKAEKVGSTLGNNLMELLLLRCQSELATSNKEEYLKKAYQLAQGKHQLQAAACLLMLGNINRDTASGLRDWEHGVGILNDIDASAWLNGRSINNPPFIPLMG